MAATETYESLYNDEPFLDDALIVVRALNPTKHIPKSKKAVLDEFLEKRRFFNVNSISTAKQFSRFRHWDDATKQAYNRALAKTNKMGTFFSSGAPKWDALKDYTIAGLGDPTNLMAVVLGFTTLGTGSALAFGAKEAAKQGAKAVLKSKMRSLTTKPVLKALAAESAVFSAGGVGHDYLRQGAEQEVGARAKGDWDHGQAALHGLLNGTLGVGTGVGLSFLGTIARGTVSKTVSTMGKALPERTRLNVSEGGAQFSNFLKNYLLPFGGLGSTDRRLIELARSGQYQRSDKSLGSIMQLREQLEKVTAILDKEMEVGIFNPKPKLSIKKPEDVMLVNRAIAGETAALEQVMAKNKQIGSVVKEFVDEIRPDTYAYANKPGIRTSAGLKNIYENDPNYTRTIYEKFLNPDRLSFDKWRELPHNKNFLGDFKKYVFDGDEKAVQLAKQLGLRDASGKFKSLPEDIIDDTIFRYIKDMHKASFTGKSRYGSLETRKEFDPIFKKLFGENYKPSMVALETFNGIIEPITKLDLASSMSRSLLSRGQAFKAAHKVDAGEANAAVLETRYLSEGYNPIEARNLAVKNSEVTPLIGHTKDSKAIFNIREDIYDPALNQIYVPKLLARTYKTIIDERSIGDMLSGTKSLGSLGNIVNAMAAAQGYIKKNLTVYSPRAHTRNTVGAGNYTLNSGNLRGAIEFTKQLIKGTPEEKQAFRQGMAALGIKASNVEMNQILSRVAQLDSLSRSPHKLSAWFGKNIIVKPASLFVSSLEKGRVGYKVEKVARDAYTGADNIGKYMTYMGEAYRMNKIWKAMTPEQKMGERINFAQLRGQPVPRTIDDITNVSAFDKKLLAEYSAMKALDVVPIYSRVPKILEYMRGLPILGSFTAFSAENLRNKYKILKIGGDEIQQGFKLGNAPMIKSGAQRLMAQGTVAAYPAAAAFLYNEAVGTANSVPMLREFLPEWMKYHAIQVRPKRDENGKLTGELGITDLSYNNPDQFVLDAIMPIMIAAANGTLEDDFDKIFANIIENTSSPFLDRSLSGKYALHILAAIKEGTGFVPGLKHITGAEGDIEKVASELAKAYKLSEPGIIKSFTEILGDAGASQLLDQLSKPLGGNMGSYIQRKLDPLYFGEDRKYLSDYTFIDYLHKLGVQYNNPIMGALGLPTGIKEITFDPKLQMGFTVNQVMGTSNANWNSNQAEMGRIIRDTSLNYSLDNLTDKYIDILNEQYVAQRELSNLVKTMSDYYGHSYVRKLLNDPDIKKAANLSGADINNVFRHKFNPSHFSDDFWKTISITTPALKGKELRKIRNHFNKIYRKYNNKTFLPDDLPQYDIK
jgi:hypothetical protein